MGSYQIRPLRESDIAAGMRLKNQAGWNQVAGDWLRALRLEPEGCFAAQCEGEVVGTVTTCVFGEVAWIAMMLVRQELRGRGIGRALMTAALGSLESAGARSVRLDATPAGRPLYESLGFQAEHRMVRYQGVPRGGAGRVEGAVRALLAGDLPAALELDYRVTSTRRGKLLDRLSGEPEVVGRVLYDGERLAGFVLTRPGSGSSQVGPCLGEGDAGGVLLDAALAGLAESRVIVDIPESHEESRAVAGRWNLTPARWLDRMGLGPTVHERRDWLWAGFGPELG